MIKLRDFTFVKICRKQSEIKHCICINVGSTSAFPQGSPKFYELKSMLRTTATYNISVQGQGLFKCFYLMKSSSSSLFDLSCLGLRVKKIWNDFLIPSPINRVTLRLSLHFLIYKRRYWDFRGSLGVKTPPFYCRV